MLLLKRLREKWNHYLERLSNANKATFGDETPDCCKLNRKNNK